MSDARDLARTWQAVLGHLEIVLPPANFKTYIEGSRALRLEDDELVVEAPRLSVDEVNGRLRTIIEQAAFKVAGRELSVLFVPRGAGAEAARADDHPATPYRLPGTAPGQVVGTINRGYTFDRYLPAEGNQIALTCCQSLLDEGRLGVPRLVFYGRPGVGKTHLLHALGSRASLAGWDVACLSVEEFTTRFTGSLRNHTTAEFQATMRSVRLLLLDDLHELVGKTRTQEELVHTIDAIENAGGYVIAASEQDPIQLDLIERLASRLSSGFAPRISPFAGAERRRYVELAAREQGISLPAWAVDRITGIEAPSVRVLQGAIAAAVTLERLRMLDLARLDAELTRIAILEATTGEFAERDLLDGVARHFELCFDDLLGQSRKPAVTAARAVAVAALQERGKSFAQIGRLLGRHRATIQDLARRGHRLLEADPALRNRFAV
jgi:chromosomal replication initiator protein